MTGIALPTRAGAGRGSLLIGGDGVLSQAAVDFPCD